MKLKTISALIVLATGCARTDIYWPPDGKSVVVDDRGRPHRAHGRAIVLNGSDALGATHVRLAGNTLEFSTAGGIDNSTSTKEGYRTIRHGITTAGLAAVGIVGLQEASSAYSANQASTSASNVAASNAASATAATKGATAVELAKIQARAAAQAAAAAKAIPAAGSTIQSTIPSIVTPVP